MSSIIYQHVFWSSLSSLHSSFLVISNFSGIFLVKYIVVGHAMIYRLSKDNKVFSSDFQQCDFAFQLFIIFYFQNLGQSNNLGSSISV